MNFMFASVTLRAFCHGLTRECHRFINPCGLALRVVAGAGAGWVFVTPA